MKTVCKIKCINDPNNANNNRYKLRKKQFEKGNNYIL